MAEFPALPLWTDSYLADTLHLSDAEHGLYLRLLMLMWRTPECRLPNDNEWLARQLRKTHDEVLEFVRPLIDEFCQSDGNWITQRRLLKERDYVRNAGKKAKKAAKAKWEGNDMPTLEQRRAYSATRSARLKAAREKGTHTAREWETLKALFEYSCVCCGSDGNGAGGIVKDHIIPIYQGGSDAIENIQPLCGRCNSSKGPDNTDHRQIIDPNWKKRLHDACKMPAPTPTPTPTPHTEPYGSSGETPPDDLKSVIFGKGLEWLAKQSGREPKNLRPVIGRWCAGHGDGKTLEAMREAQRDGPVDPVAYIEKILSPHKGLNGHKPIDWEKALANAD